MLRRPRLPLDVLYGFNERVNARPELFEEELIRFFSQPAMLEAIYIASPELYDSFTGLIDGRVRTGVHKLRKTLYKYLVRMTSRSTPYGLFAGCSLGTVGRETRIEFDEALPYDEHARLDMNYVAEMAAGLLKKKAIRNNVKFFRNTSLYRIGSSYRYIESSLHNKRRSYVLASVDCNPYLDQVLSVAAKGATIHELVHSIVSEEISEEEAAQYVDTIVDAQILVSELAATVTGEEFFFTIAGKLNGIAGAEEDLFQLNRISDLLESRERGVGRYKEIEAIVAEHFVSAGSKDLIQTDLFLPTRSCIISERVIGTLTKEFKSISFLGHRNPQPEMDRFKKRFLKRYEQREMPLLEVLDCETGIGYGDAMAGRTDHVPLLDEIQLPEIARTNTAELSAVAMFKERLCRQSGEEGALSVCLTDDMLSELRKTVNEPPPPDSFYLFGNLIAGSQDDLDEGNFKFAFNAMGGPSGLKLLGRFCHGHEPLSEQVKMAVGQEERFREDAVFAEIAHLPEARVGNVLMRPHFRRYEIPYLAGSTMPEENQILPDDLMVSVSASGEVLLRSKRLNKRVLPRLTNAHNFAAGLPVYRFLCELAYQDDYQYLAWHWGHLSSNTFLPRIEYKHWILSRATWNIERDRLIRFFGKDTLTAKEWRVTRGIYNIPRFVQLRHGDSEFLIDGDSDFAVEVLCDSIRKHDRVILTEFPEHTDNGMLGKPGKRYVNEILLPLLCQKDSMPVQSSFEHQLALRQPGTVKRSFMAGSEWLYVKIYAGTRTTDGLLASIIKPLTDRLLAEGTIEKWFFVRYEDPDHHIRLRFYNGCSASFWQVVLTELHALIDPLLRNGTVHKIQVDTYKRELERYGHHAFEEVESIFFADSVATAGFLGMLSGDEGERYRWLIGLRAVDMLLHDLDFSLEDKKMLMGHLQAHFFQEFQGDTRLSVQLNNKYRLHTDEIQSFLDPHHDSQNGIEDAIGLFEMRSACIRASMTVLSCSMEISLNNFASSLIHMFLNRLFVSQQREHELVVYHYLKKHYDSKLARRDKTCAKAILQEH